MLLYFSVKNNEENPDIKFLKSLMNELSDLVPANLFKKLGVKLGFQQAEVMISLIFFFFF